MTSGPAHKLCEHLAASAFGRGIAVSSVMRGHLHVARIARGHALLMEGRGYTLEEALRELALKLKEHVEAARPFEPASLLPVAARPLA